MNRLTDRLRTLPAIQRRVALAALVVAALALYGWLVMAASQNRARLLSAVPVLQGQAAQLERHAAEYTTLRAKPAVSLAQSDLRTVVQSHVDQAGLSSALVRIDATDRNRVQITFGSVAFADWMKMLRELQSQQTRLETCRIEALSTPGLVSITAQLLRSPVQ